MKKSWIKRGNSKLKKKSKNKKAILLRRAVEVFNRWIRERDRIKRGGKCYTCPAQGSEAGHFKHSNNSTKFNEHWVNLQCTRCNKWLSGNLGVYAVNLIDEHGREDFDKINKESIETHNFTIQELEWIIEYYKLYGI